MPMEMSTAKFVELKEQIHSKFLSPVGDIFIQVYPRVQLILLIFIRDMIHYGLRNFGFKNTLEDGPLLNPENF